MSQSKAEILISSLLERGAKETPIINVHVGENWKISKTGNIELRDFDQTGILEKVKQKLLK